MNFAEWEPVYAAILADFGYPRRADERARDRLAARTTRFDEDRVSFDGQVVAIAGGAPTLVEDLDMARRADVVVAASNAASVLVEAAIPVGCVVTDVDRDVATAQALSHDGVPVAVHAHGDNMPAIETALPAFSRAQVLPTTQAAPRGPVQNYGGFTDGDRAAFLADHFGAARLVFPGWAFDDPSVSVDKRRKLVWAERLLYWLECRRGERFAVLDGRRARITPVGLPG